jgi:hypothetical protein
VKGAISGQMDDDNHTANGLGRFFVYDRSHDLLFEVAKRKTQKPTP